MRTALLLAILAAVVSGQTQPVMKYGVRVQPGPMDSVLLKDYAPESSLVVPETRVDKARFPVIDVHAHTGQSQVQTAADVDAWVRTMDEVGVETTIVFTGATGAEFDRQAELFSRYPKRFQLWCSLDTTDLEAPDYPQRAVRELERCYRKGARGVGEITDKGSGIQRDALPRDKRLHFDDARLAPVWEKCAELKLPVNVHIADHPSCWRPLGTAPGAHPGLPALQPVRQGRALLRGVARHARPPAGETPAHHHHCLPPRQSGQRPRRARGGARSLSQSLRGHLRARLRNRTQPRTAVKFLARYADRVLFGTDMERDAAMYRDWWRLLETADEYIPGRIWWRYYGLELPAPVLESLYRGNARRILNWKPL